MIDARLAKQLKDNGFPQKEDCILSYNDIDMMSNWDTYQMARKIGGTHCTFDSSIMGYSEKEPDFFEHGKFRPSARFTREYLDSEEGKRFTVYIPTLEELIEACGIQFDRLERVPPYKWICPHWQHALGVYSSPEEAVAKLWLEINNV